MVPKLNTFHSIKQISGSHYEMNKNKRNKNVEKKLRCTYIPWRWLSFCYHVEGNKRVASRRLRYANKHIMRRCDIDTEDYEC